ncbi:GPR1/FUN34/YaaH family transporter [Microbacterium sp. cx-55]|uniref:acetate uptake transporter family protein n=1 Tax=unclassified Microbacterium TaxID=2609290 RepID=UPI001CBF980D|nr:MULTISPECIES: GPR1/FUN34/YaaH family transporter [unclassified Microbacterium]MBZ4488547.1 GPR1/FUN34/YaaH family transporter [Microbacterium sp. cx-55]MCC4909688.1 GPR1/FUN34/YaaH family transporter [Microbacterium sp. cx-59]UGB36130.1 GPR1/FUN34/YaaH family transporter [Microbacterium sp. cx-55]
MPPESSETSASASLRGYPFQPADPGLIGLLGFVIATVTAQLAHLGLQDESAVFWIGAAFGGIVQVTAGMLSYFVGDDFHFIVYNAFGWYWIVVPGFLLGEELGFFEVTAQARGVFALIFALLALGFAPAGAMHNSVLPVTLLCVSVGLGLQSAAAFTGVEALAVAGSLTLLAASALALYLLAEKFCWRTMHRRVIPIGPPWISGSTDPEA